ncbi:TPA: hypothetical protein ROX88_003268 [Bacillus pseudomycoides]|nr:hypothetical protein [Bacillus pseudomycoides]
MKKYKHNTPSFLGGREELAMRGSGQFLFLPHAGFETKKEEARADFKMKSALFTGRFTFT